jgi:hypothetical protein
LESEGFMLNAGVSYPVSWAFVLCLLNSTEVNMALFDDPRESQQAQVDPGTAMEQVFGKEDL